MKTRIIAERVNEFFEHIFALKASEAMKQYLDFCDRTIERSAFNNTLVFIQKPDCFYYATKSQWKERFERTIKDFARPLLILFPFAPVEFVYDLEDTEGKPLPKNFIYWWREGRSDVSEGTLGNLFTLCGELGIKTSIASAKYIEHHGYTTFGVASLKELGKERKIELHPRYASSDVRQESLGILIHEIAHHLLGHLGEISVNVPPKDGKERRVIVARAHQENDRGVREVEAELTAWLVFAKFGLEKQSSEYLAGWLTKEGAKGVRMNEICKVVEEIYAMSRKKRWWMKKASS